MKNFRILFLAEVKRFFTPAMIITMVVIVAIGSIIGLAMGSTGQVKSVSIIAEASVGFISFFAVLIFSAGIIGADIKSGWMRTLLIRNITRQEYAVTKITVVAAVSLAATLIASLLPALYFTLTTGSAILFDAGQTATVITVHAGEMVLYIVISSFISCWMTGAFNSLAIYIWMAGAQMIKLYLGQKYWDVSWVMTAKDFLFPAGFQNALIAVKAGSTFPTADLLWGVASIAFFATLTLYSINKVQPDVSSE